MTQKVRSVSILFNTFDAHWYDINLKFHKRNYVQAYYYYMHQVIYIWVDTINFQIESIGFPVEKILFDNNMHEVKLYYIIFKIES